MQVGLLVDSKTFQLIQAAGVLTRAKKILTYISDFLFIALVTSHGLNFKIPPVHESLNESCRCQGIKIPAPLHIPQFKELNLRGFHFCIKLDPKEIG